MNKKILALVATLSFFSLKAQETFINGPFNVIGEIGIFSNLQTAADAQFFFQDGSTLHMLGASTIIHSDAEIFANNSFSQSGTGRILFVGNSAQTLNGGNSASIGGAQPSFVNLAVDNVNNLTLTGANTRIVSGLDFVNGHILLGDQNLELSSTATATNANGSRHVVTNGVGFMAKEGFATAFDFPVGRATSDYTPARISPNSSDDFFVQAKSYNESASDEYTTADGIDRTWNIYSTSGAGATISFQHNSSTNGANYTANGGDAAAFVTQYQGLQWVSSSQRNQRVWQLGTGVQGTNTLGTISGSVWHSRAYSATVTSSTANGAFFSKSTLPLTPLPILLLDFVAFKAKETSAMLTWETSSEVNSAFFEVETSSTGDTWTQIGKVKAQGTSFQVSNYKLEHTSPVLGANYYRLNLVDLDGRSEYSPIRMVDFGDLQSNFSNIQIYPNPAHGFINIRTDNRNYNYTLLNMESKVLAEFKNQGETNDFAIDLNQYANGVYYIKASSLSGEVKVFKIVLNK
jgi:hypothetical protein